MGDGGRDWRLIGEECPRPAKHSTGTAQAPAPLRSHREPNAATKGQQVPMRRVHAGANAMLAAMKWGRAETALCIDCRQREVEWGAAETAGDEGSK